MHREVVLKCPNARLGEGGRPKEQRENGGQSQIDRERSAMHARGGRINIQ